MTSHLDHYDTSIDTATVCAHCNRPYGDHWGMRCEEDGAVAFEANPSPMAAEVQRLRALAATCYAGLGAECNLPERWLDVLNAAANGEPFDTEGLLPFKYEPFPAIDPNLLPTKETA